MNWTGILYHSLAPITPKDFPPSILLYLEHTKFTFVFLLHLQQYIMDICNKQIDSHILSRLSKNSIVNSTTLCIFISSRKGNQFLLVFCSLNNLALLVPTWRMTRAASFFILVQGSQMYMYSIQYFHTSWLALSKRCNTVFFLLVEDDV